MKPAEYWQRRSEEVAQRQFDKADQFVGQLRKDYAAAKRSIRDSMLVFYKRYANENDEVSLLSAKKLLTSGEVRDYRMSLEEFIAKAKDNADGRWTKQLNAAYYRTRVSRLDALQTQLRQEAELLAGKQQKGVRDLLGDAYGDTYYRTLHQVQTGAGIGASFARINRDGLQTVLGAPYAGSNWSERIWADRDKLAAEIRTKLLQAFIRGDRSTKAVNDIMERFDVSRSNAERLVHSETAFYTGQAALAGYKANGVVQRYEIIATLDRRTSDICRGMDGKNFALSEAEVGITYPPFHARCRTTQAPYFGDDVSAGERAARDDAGKTYFVPGDMTYPDWHKKYVDSSNPPKHDILKPVSYKTFTSKQEVKDWEAQVAPGWLALLTDEEKSAIRKYTGSAYYDINNYLRRGGKEPAMDELVSYISSGLQKFDLRDNLIVYRGLESNIFGVPPDELEGIEFRDDGYMSTTLLEEVVFDGNVMIEIRIPAGSTGAAINPLSLFADVEYEFLLDRGTTIRIVKAVEEDGKIIITAEVVPDG